LVAVFSLLLPTRVAQEIWWHKTSHQEHLGAENIDKAMLANFKLVPCDPYKWSYGVPKKMAENRWVSPGVLSPPMHGDHAWICLAVRCLETVPTTIFFQMVV